jgi:hypothetical protein
MTASISFFPKVMAAVALDDTAIDGMGGLYITAVSNVQGDHGTTSNHVSL